MPNENEADNPPLDVKLKIDKIHVGQEQLSQAVFILAFVADRLCLLVWTKVMH
ncbi:hypothetical protein J2S00_003225 [Caldalkalibacillus uzonensis]|uniref:Uncharacterized protein n=1 Tax=Caldalkalibacillus uzonensis TaxID=353224 RepID=A0ABU0CVH5_9BACI|nr:hypothetical protein [Caldalkalibacillus uzonensis]